MGWLVLQISYSRAPCSWGLLLFAGFIAYSFIALARAVRPLMQKRGGGSMLTLTYLGSERVFKNYNVMGVAKAALEASVRYLAAELGADNIRVNAISAGPIKTLAAMGISGFSSILGVYRERSPLGRNIDASEVADAAVFLLGPGGRAITAEVLMVDAGFHKTRIVLQQWNRRFRPSLMQLDGRVPDLFMVSSMALLGP